MIKRVKIISLMVNKQYYDREKILIKITHFEVMKNNKFCSIGE